MGRENRAVEHVSDDDHSDDGHDCRLNTGLRHLVRPHLDDVASLRIRAAQEVGEDHHLHAHRDGVIDRVLVQGPLEQAQARDHVGVVEDAESRSQARVEEQGPAEADDEAHGQERDRLAPSEPRAQAAARSRRRSRRADRSTRCSREAPTTAAHPRSCSAATTTACAEVRAGTARTSPSRRAPRSTRTRSPRCTAAAAGAGAGRGCSGTPRRRGTGCRWPSRRSRTPSAAASARCSSLALVVRAAARFGVEVQTTPKMTTISPNSVPSMMSWPTSGPFRPVHRDR